MRSFMTHKYNICHEYNITITNAQFSFVIIIIINRISHHIHLNKIVQYYFEGKNTMQCGS